MSKKLHSLLSRQVRRHLGSGALTSEMDAFIEAVDSAYRQFDDDREMLERSLELSSKELLEANMDLRNLLEELREEVRRRTMRLDTEVGERKKAEDKYRQMFENALEGMFHATVAGQIRDANPAYARILGYHSPEEVIRELKDVQKQIYVHPEERERFLDTLRTEGKVEGYEVELYTRERQRIWISIRARALHDDNGDFVGIQGMILDVTERRRYEAALKEAKEQAEAASVLMSSFLSMVSHELRTPLTSVLGFAKMVRKKLQGQILPRLQGGDEAVDNTLRQMDTNLAIILDEGERLTELINDVLDLSKLESGQIQWNLGPVDVVQALRRARNSLSVLAGRKGLVVEIDAPPDLPNIYGDRDRIAQVLINLLSNAVKFTERGAITCRARLDGQFVVLGVRDEGIGIPQDNIRDIFDKFKQLGDTLTGKPKGTGLGLAICKEIVEQHGGRIWVRSTPGKGSEFSFTLPLSGPIAEAF
jgi:PAS domain S-box-containing protein